MADAPLTAEHILRVIASMDGSEFLADDFPTIEDAQEARREVAALLARADELTHARCLLLRVPLWRDGVTTLYVDTRGQVPVRYLRLLRVGRFELALTWIGRAGGVSDSSEARKINAAGGITGYVHMTSGPGSSVTGEADDRG